MGNIIKSVENPQTSRNVLASLRVSIAETGFRGLFFWDGVLYGTPHLGGNPDSWRQFDKTIQFDFVSLANLGSAVQPIFVVDLSITAVVGGVTYVCAFPANINTYWNYQSSYQSSDTYFGYALLQYYFYRYTGRLEYNRILRKPPGESIRIESLRSICRTYNSTRSTTESLEGISMHRDPQRRSDFSA